MAEKEKNGGSIKASFSTRKFRGGAYAMVLSVIAVALVIVVNLLVTKLDIQVDLTDDGKFSLDEQTIRLLKDIDEEITIYYFTASGGESPYFDNLFTKYDDYNSLVKIAYKDPVLHPRFASQYVEDAVSEQSFLVVNETNGRAKYVPYTEAVVTELNYNTFRTQVTGVSLENALNSAIQYVTNDNLPVIYNVQGHGEGSISTTLSGILTKNNITLNEVRLVTQEAVPEDCDILLINQPQTDYMPEEITMIREYLAAGGDAILILDFMTPELANFNELLTYYGMDVHEGILLEGDSRYIMFQAPYVILPTVYNTELTESVRGRKYVVTQLASGITIREDKRESLSIEKLLETSEESYIKPASSESLEKEEGDLSGRFCVGLKLTEPAGSEETRIAVYSAKYFLEDTLIANSSYGNMDILLNTINSFTEQENAVAVAAKSLAEPQLTVASATANQIAVGVAVLLPLAIIGIGIIVVVRRRRK
ncbi:MAG: GldG family protein [Lachnospiraceae bacterium]|nr:GldG family protein [Lachnospiraceae bacterium]